MCPLFNMHKDQGERHKLFRASKTYSIIFQITFLYQHILSIYYAETSHFFLSVCTIHPDHYYQPLERTLT